MADEVSGSSEGEDRRKGERRGDGNRRAVSRTRLDGTRGERRFAERRGSAAKERK